MPTSVTLSIGTLYAFLLVLARVSGALVFVPLPGIKGGAPLLTLRAFLMTLPVWVGDYVALTHTKMPDLTTGNLGVTNRIYEVIDRQPDYASGTMQYKVLDTGLTGRPGAYTWGSTNPLLIGTGTWY